MKFCTHCGAELLHETVICTGCGCPVEENLQPSSNLATKVDKKFTLKHIILVVVVAVVLIGAVVSVIVAKNNARKQEICDALEGNRYSYTDYNFYTLTSLKFNYNNQCEWYKFYSSSDRELEFTFDYSIKFVDDDVYVVVSGDTYKAVINSFGEITALVDEKTGDRYN